MSPKWTWGHVTPWSACMLLARSARADVQSIPSRLSGMRDSTSLTLRFGNQRDARALGPYRVIVALSNDLGAREVVSVWGISAGFGVRMWSNCFLTPGFGRLVLL